jgi:hypothetical protein
VLAVGLGVGLGVGFGGAVGFVDALASGALKR